MMSKMSVFELENSLFDESPTGSSIRPKICAATCQCLTGQFIFIPKPKEWVFTIPSASSPRLSHEVKLFYLSLKNCGAYCVKLSAIKLNLNSKWDGSVISMQIKYIAIHTGTHLRQGSLWLKTLFCMILFCMWGILFPKHAPIYKVSVAALALISCGWHKR